MGLFVTDGAKQPASEENYYNLSQTLVIEQGEFLLEGPLFLS